MECKWCGGREAINRGKQGRTGRQLLLRRGRLNCWRRGRATPCVCPSWDVTVSCPVCDLTAHHRRKDTLLMHTEASLAKVDQPAQSALFSLRFVLFYMEQSQNQLPATATCALLSACRTAARQMRGSHGKNLQVSEYSGGAQEGNCTLVRVKGKAPNSGRADFSQSIRPHCPGWWAEPGVTPTHRPTMDLASLAMKSVTCCVLCLPPRSGVTMPACCEKKVQQECEIVGR